MTDTPLLSTLGFVTGTHPDLDHVERKFILHVKERIQTVSHIIDAQETEEAERWLRQFYARFFEYSLEWLQQETQAQKESEKKTPPHSEAPKIKKIAYGVLKDLQNNMIEYAVCYMRLHSFMAIIRDVTQQEEERMLSLVAGVKWTPDVGILMARYRKRKKEIIQQEENFISAKDILKTFEKSFSEIETLLTTLFGKGKSRQFMRSYVAALRVSSPRKVRKFFREVEDTRKRLGTDKKTAEQALEKLRSINDHIAAIIEENKDILKGDEEKLILRPGDPTLVKEANEKELAKMNLFMARYHLPYMEYKLDSLVHLREKILVFTSMESLLTLYKQLISGLIAPMSDIKSLRIFENDVLGQIVFLLANRFQEIPNILERGHEIVKEFRMHREEFKEIEDDVPELSKTPSQATQASS